MPGIDVVAEIMHFPLFAGCQELPCHPHYNVDLTRWSWCSRATYSEVTSEATVDFEALAWQAYQAPSLSFVCSVHVSVH